MDQDERNPRTTPADPYAGIFRAGRALDEEAERTEIGTERADREAEAAGTDDDGTAGDEDGAGADRASRRGGEDEPDAPHGLPRSVREDAAIASADPDREAILSDDLVDDTVPSEEEHALERDAAEADALEASRGTHA